MVRFDSEKVGKSTAQTWQLIPLRMKEYIIHFCVLAKLNA
jgi:hypothetical protein